MNRNYLIYGHGGSYNHGGEAITRCTASLLRQISPSCRIVLCSHFPEQDAEFVLPVDEIVARNLNGKTNTDIYKDAIFKITPQTICIHVGGDNYCYPNWQRYAAVHHAALQKNAKSILWSCSIDPDSINEELLAVLQTHHLITARECITYNTLIKYGLKNVVQVADIAFILEPETVVMEIEDYVAMNLSPLVVRKNPVVLAAYKMLIEYILNETDLNIALVPHVMMSMDNDIEILNELYNIGSDRITSVSDKLSAAQYKHIISKARFCIASRTHACIAAYSACVPVLAVGYSSKAAGIACDLGVEAYVIDIADIIEGNEIVNGFKALVRNEEGIHQQLITLIPQYRQKAIHPTILRELN